MSSQKTFPTPKILEDVKPLLDNVTMLPGDNFLWSPKDRTVVYALAKLENKPGKWSLLHEIAHAVLDHQSYESDFELLQLEVAAWEQAKQLAARLKLSIDDNYVEDCLDTYRDWLHQRSTCPTCGSVGLQHNPREYRCHNCNTAWHVTASRFCRPYRMKQTSGHSKKSPDQSQTTFQ